jgi:hypothetical protein
LTPAGHQISFRVDFPQGRFGCALRENAFFRKKEKRDMKKFLTLGFAAATALALTTGCQKKEAAAPETAPAAQAPAVVEETGTAATATTTTSTGTDSTGTMTTTTTTTETAPATATPAAK